MIPKPLRWVSAKEEREVFPTWPQAVRDKFADCLRPVQTGRQPLRLNTCKPWQGLGSGIHELSSGSFRLVFAWKFPEAVYVLHVFQKDSARGAKTRSGEVKAIERAWDLLKRQRAAAGLTNSH